MSFKDKIPYIGLTSEHKISLNFVLERLSCPFVNSGNVTGIWRFSTNSERTHGTTLERPVPSDFVKIVQKIEFQESIL